MVHMNWSSIKRRVMMFLVLCVVFCFALNAGCRTLSFKVVYQNGELAINAATELRSIEDQKITLLYQDKLKDGTFSADLKEGFYQVHVSQSGFNDVIHEFYYDESMTDKTIVMKVAVVIDYVAVPNSNHPRLPEGDDFYNLHVLLDSGDSKSHNNQKLTNYKVMLRSSLDPFKEWTSTNNHGGVHVKFFDKPLFIEYPVAVVFYGKQVFAFYLDTECPKPPIGLQPEFAQCIAYTKGDDAIIHIH